MPMAPAIPGQWCALDEGQQAQAKDWKTRHFVVDGFKLKLFGKRGKTFKGQVNLLAVTALRPTTDSSGTAPTGTVELHVRSTRSKLQVFLLAPESERSADLFLALGNAVPSHATSDDLWRAHMGSRPAAGAGPAHEYRLGRTLGTGTFGKVKLAQRVSDGQKFAIKCLNRARIVLAAQGGRLAREIRLLKLLNHPNVIRLHEVLHTPSEILMVMEYVEGGDLLDVLNSQPRFKEQEVRHIFTQICCGVAFCHSLGVAHRDLKPENILIERCEPGSHMIRVADFGLSCIMQAGQMLTTACGSPHYVAPEVLNFDGSARYDGRESDVWSLGVILHVMLCYKLPFEADSTHLLYKKIRQGLPSLPEHLSQPARTLLMGMLQVDPDQRMTLPQVTQSEWLKVGEVEVPQLSQLINAMSLQGELPASAWTRDPIVASRLKFNADGSAEPAPNAPSVRRAFTLPASMLNQDTFLVPDDEREKNFAHEF